MEDLLICHLDSVFARLSSFLLSESYMWTYAWFNCRKRHNLVANFGPRFALDVFKCNLYNNFSVDRFIDDSHNTDWTWNWSNYGYFGLIYVKNIPSVPSQAVKSVWLPSKSIPKQGFSCIFGAIWRWSNRHNGLGPFCLWQCFCEMSLKEHPPQLK